MTNYSSIKFRGGKQKSATKTCHHQPALDEETAAVRERRIWLCNAWRWQITIDCREWRDSTGWLAKSHGRKMRRMAGIIIIIIICRERSGELSWCCCWESIEQIFSDYISDFFHASVCVCQTQIQIRFY